MGLKGLPYHNFGACVSTMKKPQGDFARMLSASVELFNFLAL